MKLVSVVLAMTLMPLAAVAGTKKAPDCGLTYVDSAAHLQKALVGKDAIKGLAVSADFNRRATPEQKKSIAALVQDIRVKLCHPVLVYGFPLTLDDIKQVVGPGMDGDGFALVTRLDASSPLELRMAGPKPDSRAGIPARVCWAVSHMREISDGKCQ